MKMNTKYLGLDLKHPLILGASSLTNNMDYVRRLEDAGIAAITMSSLFEEQIIHQQLSATFDMDAHADSHGEATSYFPQPETFTLGPDDYLEQLSRIKKAVAIPVIGSLNGVTDGGWLYYAKRMQEAGADAVELNYYMVSTNPDEDCAAIERRAVEMLTNVKREVSIPVAVKLSPFYSALPHFARQLVQAGADGLVLFNRFYQPDIDIEELAIQRSLRLSDPSELLLRLRWLAILHGQIACTLAASGGVHSAQDIIKVVMTGANAVQLVSAILANGIDHIDKLVGELKQWLEEHEYESLTQMRGSMSLQHCPEPQAFERANYAEILQTWKEFRI